MPRIRCIDIGEKRKHLEDATDANKHTQTSNRKHQEGENNRTEKIEKEKEHFMMLAAE